MDDSTRCLVLERLALLEQENADIRRDQMELRKKYTQSLRKLRVSAAGMLLVTGVLLTFGPGRTAVAQGSGNVLDNIEAAILNLQAEDNTIAQRQATHDTSISTEARSINDLQKQLNKVTSNQAADQLAISGLSLKTKYMDSGIMCGYPATFFRACNVYIQDGEGRTAPASTPNGLGNLIIGYNEGGANEQFGCHNLILGVDNSYTSYGGIVDGMDNSISGPCASVLGGEQNNNLGHNCVIVSGTHNSINGQSSAILSGDDNLVMSAESAIVSGTGNEVTAPYACVVGGAQNAALGQWSTVSAGTQNGAMQAYSWIGGGENNHSEGVGSAVSGGSSNVAQGDYSSITGGSSNLVTGLNSTISGGISITEIFPDSWTARGYLIP